MGSEIQPGYRMCFVCGWENPIGLNVTFYSEDGRVRARFTPDERHQGFPGLVHGGILFALLDEVISRAAYLMGDWVLTGRVEVRYARPARVGEPLELEGWVERAAGRGYLLAGRLTNPAGETVVEGRGVYVKLPAEFRRRLGGRPGALGRPVRTPGPAEG